MKISEESSEEIIIKIYHPDLIDKDKGVKIFLQKIKNIVFYF